MESSERRRKTARASHVTCSDCYCDAIFFISLFDRTVRTVVRMNYVVFQNIFQHLIMNKFLFFQIQCLLADSGTDRKENFALYNGPGIFFALSYSQRFVSG